MLRVGLTGGMGSGKTTVARLFETLGVPVYNADEVAKRLMNTDENIRGAIIDAFGQNSYEGTKPNRSFIISNVLNNPRKLSRLNAIVHPATMADAEKWLGSQQAPYAIKEAAILFESGAYKRVDRVVGVSAPESVRIERILMRDTRTIEEIRKWMSRQMDEKEKMSRCDFIIYNDGRQMLIPQVLILHRQLLKIAVS